MTLGLFDTSFYSRSAVSTTKEGREKEVVVEDENRYIQGVQEFWMDKLRISIQRSCAF
jgi:hypothetical protein